MPTKWQCQATLRPGAWDSALLVAAARALGAVSAALHEAPAGSWVRSSAPMGKACITSGGLTLCASMATPTVLNLNEAQCIDLLKFFYSDFLSKVIKTSPMLLHRIFNI